MILYVIQAVIGLLCAASGGLFAPGSSGRLLIRIAGCLLLATSLLSVVQFGLSETVVGWIFIGFWIVAGALILAAGRATRRARLAYPMYAAALIVCFAPAALIIVVQQVNADAARRQLQAQFSNNLVSE